MVVRSFLTKTGFFPIIAGVFLFALFLIRISSVQVFRHSAVGPLDFFPSRLPVHCIGLPF